MDEEIKEIAMDENQPVKEPNLNEEVGTDARTELNIQNFMNDMQLVGEQSRSREIVKPNFHYGDLTVTNYLLWMILGEIMNLNDELKGGTQ